MYDKIDAIPYAAAQHDETTPLPGNDGSLGVLGLFVEVPEGDLEPIFEVEVILSTATLGTHVDLSGLNQGLAEAGHSSRASSNLLPVADCGFSCPSLSWAWESCFQGITALSGALSGVFGTMVDEAQAAERTQAQLGAVLQSTGGKAGMTPHRSFRCAARAGRLWAARATGVLGVSGSGSGLHQASPFPRASARR